MSKITRDGILSIALAAQQAMLFTKGAEMQASKNGTGPNKQGQSTKNNENKNSNGKVKAVIPVWTEPSHVLGLKLSDMSKSGAFEPSVDPNVFSWIMPSLLLNQTKEVSGYGRVDYDDDGEPVITFMDDPVATGSSAHVATSPQNEALGMMRVIEATGKGPNLHYHTHPAFSTFWSHTDKRDMLTTVEDAVGVSDTGEMFFLVIGEGFTNWLMRHYVWDKDAGVIEYSDARVWLYHAVLDMESDDYSYSYGDSYIGWGQYNATGWQKRASASQSPQVVDDDGSEFWIRGVSMDRRELALELGFSPDLVGVENALIQLKDMYPESWEIIANTPEMWSGGFLWQNAYMEGDYGGYAENGHITIGDEMAMRELEQFLGMEDNSLPYEISQELSVAYGVTLAEYLEYGLTIQDLDITLMYDDEPDQALLPLTNTQGDDNDDDTVRE